MTGLHQTQKNRRSGYDWLWLLLINAAVVALLNVALYYLRSRVSYAELRSYEYIVFIGQFIFYAWLFIVVCYYFNVGYRWVSLALSSDIILKITSLYLPLESETLMLVFWLILIYVGQAICGARRHSVLLCVIVHCALQLLILKEFIFSLADYDPIFYFRCSSIMLMAVNYRSCTRLLEVLFDRKAKQHE
jgi:hypothetical protein